MNRSRGGNEGACKPLFECGTHPQTFGKAYA